MWDSASWIVGSKASPGSPKRVSPWAATTRSSCSATPAEALVERAVLARPVDVVEDLDDRRQGLVRRVLAHQLAVTLDPALVVEVLGLEPLEVGGPLGELLLDGRPVGLLGGGVASAASTSVSLAISAAASPNEPAGSAEVSSTSTESSGCSDWGSVTGARPRCRCDPTRQSVVVLVDDLGVDHVVVGLAGAAVAATRGRLVGLGGGVHGGAHLLAGLAELGDRGLDLVGAGVGVVEHRLEGVEVGLHLGLHVLGDLLAVVAEELLGLVDQRVGLVAGLDAARGAWRPRRRTAPPRAPCGRSRPSTAPSRR